MNPQQQTLQEYYEALINRQSSETNVSTDTHKKLITQFHTMNKSIQYKLQHYTKLISTYMDKVENSFLLSFTKVLQKMGNDLMLAEQAYKSIDKEIMANQKCVNLTQDKIFFINESNYYQQEFTFKSKQVEKLKQKNYLLIKENTGLKQKLFEKVKQNMFYKQKCKKLQKLRSNNTQNQNQPQNNTNQQPTPFSPSKISVKSRLEKSQQKKWASYGRQTQQQKRQKEEEKQKEKKNLLVDIKKQLKTRQNITLDQIINRTLIQSQQNLEVKHFSLKKAKFSEKNECYREKRMFKRFDQKQSQNQNKSMMNSTVASNFPHSQIQQTFNQRDLHTSQKNVEHKLKN